MDTGKVGLVLSGAAARGAYEAGVARYIVEKLPETLGREVPLDILSGTSAGAINACFLAARAEDPRGRGKALAERWSALEIRHVIVPDMAELFAMARGLLGGPPGLPLRRHTRGALLDPAGLERVLGAIPFDGIETNLRAGRVSSVCVSTTHIGSGRTVLFTASRDAKLPVWHGDPLMSFRRVKLSLEHVRASSAIPFLFPAVEIDGELHCDGGLRQTVPLSPARRLGAESLIVVSPHRTPAVGEPVETLRHREAAAAGPYFLIGKTLDALLLDRLDSDVQRMERVNAILDAGTREYGPQFVERLNARLRADGGSGELRRIRTVAIRSSEDIGRMSLAYVRSKTFAKRTRGIAARLMRRLGEGEGGEEADFLSYLLFDGPFAAKLLDLGWSDAAARHDDLGALFENARKEHAA